MTFAKHYTKFLILPAVLSLVALAALLLWGLRPSIDLSGGSLLQVSYPSGRPAVEQVQAVTSTLGLGGVRVQASGADGYMLSARTLSTDEKNTLESALATLGSVQEQQFSSVGPSIGAETLHKGLFAIVLVSLTILCFIAFAFRQVSEPVASWKYGVITIVSLVHDILLPAGIFAALGHFVGAQVDSLFIVALLTILGVSINDKIVVFDRIRENLRMSRREALPDVVNRSINQTLSRTVLTSGLTFVTVLSLYVFGGQVLRGFSFALVVGIIIGTYSSIAVAAPMLVAWQEWRAGREKNAALPPAKRSKV